MRKLFLLICLLGISMITYSQNYPNIVNYHFGATPTKGVKIKTNIPFTSNTGMPTVNISGYDYGKNMTLNLNITWYIYNNAFFFPSVSSYGGSIPPVWLANENGKVVIFLDEKVYYQRFTISAFAHGMKETANDYKGWVVVDDVLSGSNQAKVSYKNNFGGNVGIGTESPQALLDVRGKIIADEVEIKVNTGADFVFAEDYALKPLAEVEEFVKENKHLPEIPSEKEMQENGLNINEFQIKLLQKIEELMLYVIELKNENKQLEERVEDMEKQLQK